MILSLANCKWVTAHHLLLITGPTEVDDGYLANVFEYQACRIEYSVVNYRISRFLDLVKKNRLDG